MEKSPHVCSGWFPQEVLKSSSKENPRKISSRGQGAWKRYFFQYDSVGNWGGTAWNINMEPENRPFAPIRNFIFQPLIFRGSVSFSGVTLTEIIHLGICSSIHFLEVGARITNEFHEHLLFTPHFSSFFPWKNSRHAVEPRWWAVKNRPGPAVAPGRRSGVCCGGRSAEVSRGSCPDGSVDHHVRKTRECVKYSIHFLWREAYEDHFFMDKRITCLYLHLGMPVTSRIMKRFKYRESQPKPLFATGILGRGFDPNRRKFGKWIPTKIWQKHKWRWK